MARHEATQALPQHRHHRAHRRGQDHDDGARAVLHGQEAPDHRGPRHQGRQDQHHHRLPRAGAQARHHDPERGGLDRVEGLPDQPDRHARARRLHDRSQPQPARARRRGSRVRRRRGRGTADRDQLAAREPVQRPAPLLRQQDGPHRRELRALRQRHQGAAQPERGGVPRSVRQLRRVRRHGRPGRGRRLHLELGRQGREWETIPLDQIPGRFNSRPTATTTGSSASRSFAKSCSSTRSRWTRTRSWSSSRHGKFDPGEAQGVHPQGHRQRQARAGVLRLVVQEQGRAAAARRRHRLPAVSRARTAASRSSTWTARCIGDAGSEGRRARARARVQGHQRPVRHADVRAHVLRRDQEERHAAQRDARPQGAHRPYRRSPGELHEGHRRGARRRHLRVRLDEGNRDRRLAVDRWTSPRCSSACASRTP